MVIGPIIPFPVLFHHFGIGMANHHVCAPESSHRDLMLNHRILPSLLSQVLNWLDGNV